jgi:uncharacterized membrane protein
MSNKETDLPPGPTPAAARKSGRNWGRVVLVVSLMLNLLVFGIVIGGAIGHVRPLPRPVISDISLGTFTAALSPEDREALRQAAEAESLGIREMHRAAREDYSLLIAALRAEPWDEQAARAAIAGYGERAHQRLEAGERLLLARLSAMGASGRKAFAQRMEAALNRGALRGER